MDKKFVNIKKIYGLIQAHKMGKYSSYLRKFDCLNLYCMNNLVENYDFIIDNPEAHSDEVHINFLNRIIKDGWVYGKKRDIEKKIEPWCVPYEDLTDEQKMIWTVGYINVKFLTM